jgi:hypothetical protein
MAITYASYHEIPGSPTQSLDARTGQLTAERRFVCDWLDRFDLQDFLLGWAHREYEYYEGVYATGVSIAPYLDTPPEKESGDNNRVLYEKALVTVTYETMVGEPKSGSTGGGNVTGCDFCEQSCDIETQFVSYPSGTLYWGDGTALDDGQSPEKMFHIKNYQVVFHNAKTIPTSWDGLIGTVNIATYEMDIRGNLTDIAIGNILFKGYSQRRSLNTFGTAGWDLTCSFAEIMNDISSDAWNHFWNPDSCEWEPIYADPNETTQRVIYVEADWSDLGLPPTPSEE